MCVFFNSTQRVKADLVKIQQGQKDILVEREALKTERGKMSRKISQLTDQVHDLEIRSKDQMESLRICYVAQEEATEHAKEEKEQLTRENQQLTEELEETTDALTEAQSSIEEAIASHDELSAQIKELETTVEEKTKLAEDMETRLTAAEFDNAELEKHLEENVQKNKPFWQCA